VLASEVLSDPSSSLGATLNHARLLLKVQRLLADSVDPSLADHFQVANLRQNRLILLAPNASWATRLRMETQGLLQTLRRAGFAELADIEVRVAPLAEQPVSSRPAKPLSTAAEQALGSMARLGAKSED
jgi:hypothetical protein